MPSQSPQRQMQPQPQMQLVQTQRVQTAPHYVTQPVAATLATPLLQHANSPAACSVAALPAFPACPFARGGSVAHNITAAAHSPFCCPPIVTMWPPVASEPVASSDEPKSKKPKKWACKECHKVARVFFDVLALFKPCRAPKLPVVPVDEHAMLCIRLLRLHVKATLVDVVNASTSPANHRIDSLHALQVERRILATAAVITSIRFARLCMALSNRPVLP
eukprot:6208216-Pleurochrysis_carterae.AAC.2